MRQEDIDKEIRKLNTDIEDLEEKENLMEALKLYEGSDEVVSSVDYIEAMALLRGDTEKFSIDSGFETLDNILEGFREGSVNVISGPTKQGKTTFCQSLTINIGKKGIKSLWFPFDTPGDELIDRFETLPLIYLPKKNPVEKKLDWIESKIIEGLAKYGTRVVFIDHLGMLTRSTSSTSNYSTEISSIMMELKSIAIRWRVIIFLNHHIRKLPRGETPNYEDLKDSSAVASDSDTVLMIWRKKSKQDGIIVHENKSIVSVETNRRTGKTGLIHLIHKGDHFIEESLEEKEETLPNFNLKDL